MQISDWVIFKKNSNYKGFIVYIQKEAENYSLSIRLTSPKELLNKVVMVNKEDVVFDNFYLTEEDIKILIDLSLRLNDKDWFENLRQSPSFYNNKNLGGN